MNAILDNTFPNIQTALHEKISAAAVINGAENQNTKLKYVSVMELTTTKKPLESQELSRFMKSFGTCK